MNDYLIQLVKGTSLDIYLYAVDQDRVPLDLTGATVVMTVRSSQTATAVSFTLSVTSTPSSAGAIERPIAGVVKLSIVPANTSALAAGQYRYDVQADMVGGAKYALIQSSPLEIIPSIR